MEKLPIFDQNHGLTPLEKNSNFSTFLTCCFYSLERLFLSLEYLETQLPGVFCLKEKLPIFDQNHGLWKNPDFSTFLT